ncbi:MAG: rod shape-determining protein MreD [Methyloprofundus sp.]|nr:rod shape-determining protein MreD [Methyloprofundus sp.]MDT8425095.1 rod shape-determining protein MreD [Methyloprofundus sp.]
MVKIKLPILIAYWLTIVVAMALNITPWAAPFLMVAPDWVLLTLIYWTLAAPETAGVGKAWMVGLLVDVLTGQLLGQYALAYALSVYLGVKQHKRIRQYPIIQQSLAVFAFLLLARVLIFWIENINHQTVSMNFWLPVLTGALVWPVVSLSLRNIRIV